MREGRSRGSLTSYNNCFTKSADSCLPPRRAICRATDLTPLLQRELRTRTEANAEAMKRIGALVAMLIGIVFAPAFADGGGVRGYVVDWKTLRPIAGVTVTVSGPVGVYQTVSDGDGFYAFLGLLSGPYTVSTWGAGHMPAVCGQPVTIFPDQIVDLNRTLTMYKTPKAWSHPFFCARLKPPSFLLEPGSTADVYDVR